MALIPVARIAEGRRTLLDRFQSAGAGDAGHAIPVAIGTLDAWERQAFDELRAARVLREASTGHWFLDRNHLLAWETKRRRRLVIALVVVTDLLVLAGVAFWFLTRR